MLIYKIIEIAKNDESIKFKPINRDDIELSVLDAYFGMFTCNRIKDNEMITANQLIQMFGEKQDYIII